jgi:hypothetical protein
MQKTDDDETKHVNVFVRLRPTLPFEADKPILDYDVSFVTFTTPPKAKSE